jgi:hypothetical protein
MCWVVYIGLLATSVDATESSARMQRYIPQHMFSVFNIRFDDLLTWLTLFVGLVSKICVKLFNLYAPSIKGVVILEVDDEAHDINLEISLV